ncbi:MAG TPA: hypothetical protein VGH65_07910 [Verrucomicrobiaceae bacterium]|jgi:polyhydroxybutyrate depolymerase
MKRLLRAILCLAPALLSLPAFGVEPVKLKWTVDGAEREALVLVPSSSSKAEHAPVVFFFHGHGGNMGAAARNLDLQSHWPEALVVYPQGVPTVSRVDPEGKKPGWQHEPGDLGDRDLKFFDAMLATLREKYPVDDHRIYSAGFSNGAGFTYLLWSQRGKYLAAVAPCAGLIRPTVHPDPARPALIITGQADPLVKFDEAQKTIAEAKKIDGCTGEGKPWEMPGTMIFSSDHATPVVTFIHSGAHIVPKGANEMIVQFFKRHAMGN